MQAFHYKNNLLHVEELSAEEIARQTGTPVFVYSQSAFLANLDAWKDAASKFDCLICYALKANDNLELLKLASQRGLGADVVSGGELFVALKAGFPPEKIVFAGVGKRAEEIRYALKTGIRALNVESRQELEVIQQIAREVGHPAPVHVRVNPDIDPQSHPYISTGMAQNKFGIEISQAIPLIKWAATQEELSIKGVHVHIGSQIKELSPFRATAKALRPLYQELMDAGIRLETFDLGGGLAVDYHHPIVIDGSDTEQTSSPDIESYASTIMGNLKDLPVNFVVEPGRSVIANTAILLVTVLYTKTNGEKKFVIVDGGMNDLIRPCLYQAYHHVLPAANPTRGHDEIVDVVGPICESADFLAKERSLPEVAASEHLAIFSAGAYGYSLASNYNGRPRAAEVLVDGQSLRIIRRAENYNDLLKLYENG